MLTSSGWMHLRDRHPEVLRLIDEVLDAVTHPDAITPDPRYGRWRYWRAEKGPTRWLFVVVDWRGAEPKVVTAFGRGKVQL